MEDLNNLLNGGEVPNLFPADERVQVRPLPAYCLPDLPGACQSVRCAGAVMCTRVKHVAHDEEGRLAGLGARPRGRRARGHALAGAGAVTQTRPELASMP